MDRLPEEAPPLVVAVVGPPGVCILHVSNKTEKKFLTT